MDESELVLGQLQRELGLVAARSEEGRRHAEEQLAAERRLSASLRAELEAERRRSAEVIATAAADSLGRASFSVEEEQCLRSAQQQLEAEQRRSSALDAALQAEQRKSLALDEALQAERQQASHVMEQHRCLEREAAQFREQLRSHITKEAQMKRELKGMSTLVRTMKRKLEMYEKKLLEQAQSCAEEINDMKNKLDGSVVSSCDETAANEGNEDESETDLSWEPGLAPDSGNFAFSLGTWHPPSVASLLPATWEPRGLLDDAEESTYVRLDDTTTSNVASANNRPDNWSPQRPQRHHQYQRGGSPPIFTNCPESTKQAPQGCYVPPVLPILADAI